ncbi:MAG: aminotransferase class I/II-fold pyridoxal phosphate-dependent enzyme [Rhodobacteraceae bacterium]|nr:aminotransferase class I/II-fold pyridoxal phosphate-dependent enzyme [Paracoccaceae bacterium]
MKQTPWLAFSFDRHSDQPIFEQICEAIRARTISGELAEGTKLPPTRVFATELGVSRSTVVTAYEQLVAEGYLHGVRGSGYTVCAVGELTHSAAPPVPDQNEVQTEERPRPLPFEASQPDMRLFPHRQWAKTVSRICRANPESMLLGGEAFGNFELRRAIAAHVSEWRGITATPQQILVTAGATDALEVCLRTLTRAGDQVALEDPGYRPMSHFAQAQGLEQVLLDIDDSGACLPAAQSAPKAAILTPSHQYPLGGAMSPSRRLEFIQWAETNKAWIIEDDYDSEFRYSGRPIPAMAGFDHLNRTIYIGSFSKIFSNALRLGYVILPDALSDGFRATMRRFGLKASYMPQQALAEFIHSGEFYRHLRRVRRIYGDRRKHLLDRLTREFSAYGSFTDHQAGMQVVFHLNAPFQDAKIVAKARMLGITVDALSDYTIRASDANGLILGFCGYTVEEMDAALDLLKNSVFQKVDRV